MKTLKLLFLSLLLPLLIMSCEDIIDSDENINIILDDDSTNYVIDFGQIISGENKSKVIEDFIKNETDVGIHINSAAVKGENALLFQIDLSDYIGEVVSPGQQFAFIGTASPTSLGLKTATFTINIDGEDQEYTLKCEGVENSDPVLDFEKDIYFIPGSGNVDMVEIVSVQINKLGTLNFPAESIVTIDKNGWVAGAIKTTEEYEKTLLNIFIAKIDGDFKAEYYDQIDLTAYKIVTHDIHNGRLFLGGSDGNKAIAYTVDLNKKPFDLVPMNIPTTVECWGIDDFMFYDEKVVLVDNIVIPKYLIFYDEDLNLTGTHKLEIAGVYQQIEKAFAGDEKILLHSTSSGYGSNVGIITTLDKSTNVQEIDTVMSHEYEIEPGSQYYSNPLVDVCFYKDRAFYLRMDNNILEWDYKDLNSIELKTNIPINKYMKSIVMVNDNVVILRNDTDYQLLTYTK
ncbi:MAG: hypothetical protein PF588_08305 [Candidatus Kapabacteria bacterium]|jgi:hypothetical protein|nr:hypothetical protein [Candidatus Kapabacteria bacterium]